jgi:hypothetical protein
MRTGILATIAAMSFSLAVSAGCASSVKVNSDYDPAVDFTSLKTWSWVEDETHAKEGASVAGNQLLSNRVTAAVERSLTARGYRQAQGSPDFRVAFTFGAQEKLDVRSSPSTGAYYGGGYRGRRGGMYTGWGGSTVDVKQYTEGTLIIDILRPGGEQLVWRGTGTTRIREEKDPEKRTQKVNDAVEKILAQFPPKKK